MVSNQVIVAGMGEVIGINYLAIKFVMDLHGVHDQREVFAKVTWLDAKILKAQREKQKLAQQQGR